MPRLIRLMPPYLRAVPRLVRRDSKASYRLVACLRSLEDAEGLPGPQDYRAATPPVGTVLVRQVPGEMLWILFAVTEQEVILRGLTPNRPIPRDEE